MFMAMLSVALLQSITQAQTPLQKIASESPYIFAHLAIMMADDSDTPCCPGSGDLDVQAVQSDNGEIFAITNIGGIEQIIVLLPVGDNYEEGFNATLSDIQLEDVADVDSLFVAGGGSSGVHCVRIDNNTILCAFSNPMRVIILCRAGATWRICFDSNHS